MDSDPYRGKVEPAAERAGAGQREQYLAGERLSRAHLWAKVSLAIAIAYAAITAAFGVITDRPLLTLAPGFATSLVFLVGTLLQRALIGSRVAQPARLGPESWSKGISLLFSVLAGYLAIVVVSMIFSEATGFSGRHLYLGFLLILLLFTAPLGFLLEASTLATQAAAVSPHGSAAARDADLRWARRKLLRAPFRAKISLAFALIAALGLGGIGFSLAWAPFEKLLLGLSGIIVLLGGILQLRLARGQAAAPATLGRRSNTRVMMLVWSMGAAHAAIAVTGMIYTFSSGEIVFAPTLGVVVSGVVLAGPCGALLDASRAASRLIGPPGA